MQYFIVYPKGFKFRKDGLQTFTCKDAITPIICFITKVTCYLPARVLQRSPNSVGRVDRPPPGFRCLLSSHVTVQYID